MKISITLFISIILLWTISLGQTKAKKIIYITKSLEYLQLINDSTVLTSIGDEHEITAYYIKADTLFIKNEYLKMGPNHKSDHIINWYDYKILKQSDDSLFLINKFRGYKKPYYWQDTLKFVAIEKLKETVTSFKYLKLDYHNPFDGTLKLTIDSLGKVIYERTPEAISGEKVLIKIKGELSPKEFRNFLDTLAYSLPSKLYRQRGCAIDEAIANFEIVYNDKKVVSKGCALKWTHAFLFNYLYDISENKGFVKRQKG